MTQSLYGVAFKGIGVALPDTVITNDDISNLVETNDEWIVSRTGFRERRVLSGDEQVTDLSIKAAQDALAYAGLTAQDVDLIIHACSTPDYIYPAGAAIVQQALGAKNAFGFDVVMGCSGLVYAISNAAQYIQTGQANCALVITADAHSRYTDWTDRNTCVLFGDGAGAIIMTRQEDGKASELLGLNHYLDGTKGMLLSLKTDHPNCPLVEPRSSNDPHHVYMNGREVFRFVVEVIPPMLERALAEAGLKAEDIDHYIFHQANIRIMDAMLDRMSLKPEQIVISLENYSNTSATTIPLAMMDAIREGKIKPGDRILFCAFGVGLSAAISIFDWNAVNKCSALAEKIATTCELC